MQSRAYFKAVKVRTDLSQLLSLFSFCEVGNHTADLSSTLFFARLLHLQPHARGVQTTESNIAPSTALACPNNQSCAEVDDVRVSSAQLLSRKTQ